MGEHARLTFFFLCVCDAIAPISFPSQGSEIEHTLPPRPLDVEEKVDVLKSYEGEWKEGYFDGLGVAVYLDGTYRGVALRLLRFSCLFVDLASRFGGDTCLVSWKLKFS